MCLAHLCEKTKQNCQNRNWCSPKPDRWFLLLSEDPSIGRILSEKKYGGAGLRSEKTEALHAGLNERVEAAANSYSAEVDFWQYLEDPIKMFSLWIFLHKHFKRY